MLAFKVPFSINFLWFLPILFVIYLVTFGISCILLHYGIFVEDLANVTALALRLVFYMSGVFYNLATKVPKPFNQILLKCNPVAFIINTFRDILLRGQAPSLIYLGLWFVIGICLVAIGIHIIHKYENSYAKVI
jgi:ABC-type polysaccharide/polyol phosphate export permease